MTTVIETDDLNEETEMNATERCRVQCIESEVTALAARLQKAREAVAAIIYPDPDGPPISDFVQQRMSGLRSWDTQLQVLIACLDVHGDWLLETTCVGGINLSSAEQSLESHIRKSGKILNEITESQGMYLGISDAFGPEWPSAESLVRSASTLADSLYHD